MSTTECKELLENTFDSVSTYTFEKRKVKEHTPTEDERNNAFLDSINLIKNGLIKETNEIDSLVNKVSQITWFNEVNDDCLKVINNILGSLKNLKGVLTRQYVGFDNLRSKGIAKTEIALFKEAIDSIKELHDDINFRFFIGPNDDEFLKNEEEFKSL